MDNEDKKIRKQDERAEETKRSIAESASRLFTARGYDAVTIREIAKEAGCSHTTIYLYFKDKEALLEQLAIQPLEQLELAILSIKNQKEGSIAQKLKEKSRVFVRFCLSHKSMVSIILEAQSVRGDTLNSEADVNQVRARIFAHLTDGIGSIIPNPGKDAGINHSRIYFFMLYGLIHTYMNSEEPLEALLERIQPVLDDGVDVILAGMQPKGQGIERGRKAAAESVEKPDERTEKLVTIPDSKLDRQPTEAVTDVKSEMQPKVKKEKSKEKKIKEQPEAEHDMPKVTDPNKEARKEKKQNKKNKDKKSKK
ncbi:TetR/AcrR family transcriptional regulator [Paenibacillus agricola]|uniref:TetR family transcriptional regulator n=1 Tax=Paenibacillus agricola TaxID=2716264 RepID=A0ABX0JCK0_9BACL|nr:TetR/AcrR family transcriptional regulator [Paenibacillus agricola]NHN32971.1 TetR family transcriptional regulator [Paenibacillus agricola]